MTKATKAWGRRLAEAYDCTTGATADTDMIKAFARIMVDTEEEIDDLDLLGRVASLMGRAYEAGREREREGGPST
jgi:hypothetical protein